MGNYTKNSVKLLQKIDNKNNTTVFYTEFDGNYEIGDMLYICAVSNSGGIQTLIDSFYNKKGYKLLSKKGNKITLDLPYSILTDNGTTMLPANVCYIGRVYINNSHFTRGNINNTILSEVTIKPSTIGDVNLIQSVLVSIKETNSERRIENMDFNNKYSDDERILKSEYTSNTGEISSHYTYNNNGFGVSFINLSTESIILDNCNVNSGTYNNCILDGNNNNNIISNGYLVDCDINKYTINNGYFNNCVLSLLNTWNYGFWLDSSNNTTNFQVIDWLDGVWVNGDFPSVSTWHNGTFMNGNFYGVEWLDGEFQSGIFSDTVWQGGIFNSGLFEFSTWNGGDFYNGQMLDSTWNGGVFHNGTMYSSDTNSEWNGGLVKDGTFLYVDWKDGEVENGNFYKCNWENGIFNNGQLLECNWENGKFYDGIIQGGQAQLPTQGDTVYAVTDDELTYSKDAVNIPYNFVCYDYDDFFTLNINGVNIIITSAYDALIWDDGNGEYVFDVQNGNADDKQTYDKQTTIRSYGNEIFNISIVTSAPFNYNLEIKSNNNTLMNTWANGAFYNGTMLDMNWSKGIVYNGIFYNTEWSSGIWYNGTAVDSKFNKVDWYNGIFNSSVTTYNTTENGTSNPYENIQGNGIIRGGIWYNGVFNNGVFGDDSNDIDSIWIKGNFYNGIYNGDEWRGGLFYKDVISLKKFIPERYKVNKNYKAYNVDRLVKSKWEIKKKVKSAFRRKVSKYITPRNVPIAPVSSLGSIGK